MERLYAFILCVILPASLIGQSYKAGYCSIFLTDSTRLYKPDSDPGDKLHFRPLEVDVWYPAETITGSAPMPFQAFTNLLEQRSNRFQDDTVYTGMSAALVQFLCANLNMPDTSKLSHFRTNSYKNAPAIKQRFPLIIYMCAYDGMSYENIPLLESLAANGYVVAAITSVGRYPGNMSTKNADLLQQVGDGLFVLDYLQHQDNIAVGKIGVMGYSWGGLAATLMAMHTDRVRAVLSLDGSEMHYYGDSPEEDSDFNALRKEPYFRASKVNVPYAYLESGHKQDDYPADSVFNLLSSLHSPSRYFRFADGSHEDFSCLPSLPALIAGTSTNNHPLYRQYCLFSLGFFNEYLGNKTGALREQESALLRQHLADTTYPTAAGVSPENAPLLKGIVRDGLTGKPLAFANISVPGKQMGTVTAQNGSFQLPVGVGKRIDSIRVSMVGYRDTICSNTNGQEQGKILHLTLQPNITKLKETVVVAHLRPTRIIGSTSTSKSMSFGFPLKFLGSEIGSRMQLGKKDVLLKRFRFTVAANRLDTAVFRLNIYRFSNGLPAENILQQNILVGVGSRPGTYAIDLAEYKLFLHGDVFVSLEWVQGSASQKNGAIFLSAALLHGATWHRTVSQGEWKKFGAVSVGFNMTVQPLTDD